MWDQGIDDYFNRCLSLVRRSNRRSRGSFAHVTLDEEIQQSRVPTASVRRAKLSSPPPPGCSPRRDNELSAFYYTDSVAELKN